MKQSVKTKIFMYNAFGFLLKFPPTLYLLRRFFIKNFGRVNSLSVHITEKCNLNCVYCSLSNQRGKDIHFEKFCKLVDEAKEKNIGEIILVGGEPFLHHDLIKMVDYCKDRSFKIAIYTNGTLIDSSLIDYLKNINNLRLVFKFDSPMSYEEHTGNDIYKKVFKTINLCTAAGIRSVARINVTKRNTRYLKNIIDKALIAGVEPVIERHIPLKQDDLNEKLELSVTEWGEAINVYNKCYASFLGVSTEKFSAYKDSQARLIGDKCYGFFSSIVVRINGEVLPCGLAPDELSIGNINSEPLHVLLGKYYKKREIWKKIPSECSNCKEAEICKGGCKAYTYLKLKCFDKKDPLCNLN